MRRTTTRFLAGLLLFRAAGSLGQAGPGEGTHVTWREESCLKCHDAARAEEIRSRIANPCSELCATCHAFKERHHAVGVAISGSVRPPLLLTKKGTNACVTCHEVTRPRYEKAPWVSQSLFERLARRPGENRTYSLVMRNDRGQLCRNCH